MKKDIGYICDPCEFVTLDLIEEIAKTRDEYQVVGIGVHSDAFFEMINHRPPIKPFEERYRMANALKGVDFVFELNSEKLGFNEMDLLPIFEEDKSEKKYHCAYAPGTYDLFHEGHLQHLLEVRSMCEILIVGVNSDMLVQANKNKHTQMDQNLRMEIVRHFKFVDHVYLVETNNKKVANDWAKEHVGCPIDVIFLGSDLTKQDPKDNPEDIPILFTERDPVIMKKRSSSFYREELKKLQQKKHNKE